MESEVRVHISEGSEHLPGGEKGGENLGITVQARQSMDKGLVYSVQAPQTMGHFILNVSHKCGTGNKSRHSLPS